MTDRMDIDTGADTDKVLVDALRALPQPEPSAEFVMKMQAICRQPQSPPEVSWLEGLRDMLARSFAPAGLRPVHLLGAALAGFVIGLISSGAVPHPAYQSELAQILINNWSLL